ncbi:hypothetical protein D1872_287860 [compost metagenome]
MPSIVPDAYLSPLQSLNDRLGLSQRWNLLWSGAGLNTKAHVPSFGRNSVTYLIETVNDRLYITKAKSFPLLQELLPFDSIGRGILALLVIQLCQLLADIHRNGYLTWMHDDGFATITVSILS